MKASHRDFELPVTAHPSLSRLLDEWRQAWERRPPTTEDLSFDALIGDYPGLFLVDPGRRKRGKPDPLVIRAGPAIGERIKREIGGMHFSDLIHPQIRKRVNDVYAALMKTGRPHYWEMANTVFGSRPDRYHRLLLPLYSHDATIEYLLGCCAWD
ncbi:MAG: hypothetical protein R3D45_10620 [Rhizobiaceae bacterium]